MITDHRSLSELAVLHEDASLLAIDKPPGIVVHPTYKNLDGTLLNALRQYAGGWADGQRPSLVGRLDKLTSGIVIVAKTPAVHAALQREMTSDRSVKEYIAVVSGDVDVERGRIDFPLAFDGHDRRRIVVSPSGLPAVTTFERAGRGGGLSVLRCRLVTGRRHQIRVHLAASGWPIVGDPTYGAGGTGGEPSRFPRQALHAARVAFRHPATGQPLSIEAPLPRDMRDLIDAASIPFIP